MEKGGRNKSGLFVVLEGIDGAGTSTQVYRLAEHVEELNKYQDILKTHEPWQDKEIKRRLADDKDAYSNAYEMADLFVGDRAKHTHKVISPSRKAGIFVIDDRYTLSTCSYQWAMGVPFEELISMHKERGILIPDATFFIDVSERVARRRLEKSGRSREKFERNPEFVNKLISAYKCLVHMSEVDESLFGKVILIDGERPVKKVTEQITSVFTPLYQQWLDGKYKNPYNP